MSSMSMRSNRRSSLVQQIKQLNFPALGVRGRDDELEALQQVLDGASGPFKTENANENDAARRTKTPVVLVRGYSGVGKSCLLAKAFEDEDKCCYCVGKHEQSKENNQFDAWNEILSALISSLEDEPTDLLDRVQMCLGEVLDNQHIRQLKGTFPVINRLLVTQIATPVASSSQFGITKAGLVKLIRVVVQNLGRPLILCLDDMQWSDHSALSLFMALANEATLHGLVLVGTYRDNEVEQDAGHILNTYLLPELEGQKCEVKQIALNNLGLEALNAIVAALVTMKPDRTLELSRVILSRTNGNAFFALQVLRLLHQQQLLYFCLDTYEWAWDLDRVAAETGLSDNVVELVTLKLKRLPQLSKRVLMIGSLIGSKFHGELMDGVLEAVVATEQASIKIKSLPQFPSKRNSGPSISVEPKPPVSDIKVNTERSIVVDDIPVVSAGNADSGVVVQLNPPLSDIKINADPRIAVNDDNSFTSVGNADASVCVETNPAVSDIKTNAEPRVVEDDDTPVTSEGKEHSKVSIEPKTPESEMDAEPRIAANDDKPVIPPSAAHDPDKHVKQSQEPPQGGIDYQGMIQDGLLTCSEGIYRFCHDRIQQAAYELFETPLEREYNHLVIGRYLQQRVLGGSDSDALAGHSNLESAKMLCCEQLNLGARCMQKYSTEKLELAKLNLEAGELAARRSAFQAAIAFLRVGLSLLKESGQDPWVGHYDTVLKMHNLLAEVLNTRGEYDEAEDVCETVLKHAEDEDDKWWAYAEMVKLLSAQNDRIKEAISFGSKALKSAGVRIPSKKAGLHHVLLEFFRVKKKLKKIKSEDELLGMAECQDEKMRLVIYTLNQVAWAGFFINEPNLMVVGSVRGLSLSLKHGLNKYSSNGLAFYACLLGSMGDFEGAYEAGELASKLMERFDSRDCNARTMASVFCLSKHLREPLHQNLDGYLKYYEEGMEGGDTEHAIGHVAAYTETYLFSGLPLQPLLKDFAGYKEQFEKFENIKVLFIFDAFAQGIHALCGQTEDPYKLNGEIIRERTFLKDVRDNHVARWAFYFVKLYVAYALNQNGPETEEAAEAFWALQNPIKGTPNFFLMNYSFLNGMVAMALEAKKGRKRKYKRIREQSIALIRTWEKKGVPWVSHMLLVLRAEKDSLNRKKGQTEVKAGYDAAIRMASRTGYLNDCALANERCARYFFSVVGDEGWGQFYLMKAVSLYVEWGANAKVRLLSDEFPNVREEISQLSESASTIRTTGIRARERFKASINDKHFAKISDLFSQELGGSCSVSLHSGGGGSSTSLNFGRSSDFFNASGGSTLESSKGNTLQP